MMSTAAPLTAEDVMSLVQERDIRFVRLWFTDILGQLKAFSINATELGDAFEGGMGFDGSSITGFNPIEESDMIAMPDPSTFAILPTATDSAGCSVNADHLYSQGLLLLVLHDCATGAQQASQG